ncbi:MAG: amidase family protein [Dehalococcoidia bacterium]
MASTTLDVFSSATTMVDALLRRKVSAVELLDMHLRQIERYNPKVNAIVTPDYENAQKAAAAADEALAGGEARALLGLPITIKDCIDVKGLLSTAGVQEWAEHRSEEDALIVSRVRAAGAVIMGKTNLPPYAMDWQSDNPLFGRTNNPWDLGRTPGGSTGGAAAVATGMTPLEFGNDLGGSIRVPAAFCGVYGHKPSETAIPRSGGYPGSELPNPASVMSVNGPLARSARDLQLAFDVVAGPEMGEDVAWSLKVPPARRDRLADYRVAVMPPISWLPVDAETIAALEELATDLRRAGAKVEETQPDTFGDMRRHHQLYLSLLACVSVVGSSKEERQHSAEVSEVSSGSGDFQEAWTRGLEASPYDFTIWLREREVFRRAYADFFNRWDVLLVPVFLGPAFPHTTAPRLERTLDVNDQRVAYGLGLVYPALANFCGQPATAFPMGITRSGLPIGLQAIGPYLEDRTPMRFAALVAQEFGGSHRPPGYDAD